jgi:hypothetical protein
MGVTALWPLLEKEGVVEHYRGSSSEDHASIVAAVDGAVVAVDLAPWLFQVGPRSPPLQFLKGRPLMLHAVQQSARRAAVA